MNDFVDIYENRISNIQDADLENDFHVAVSHMGITPRVYVVFERTVSVYGVA